MQRLPLLLVLALVAALPGGSLRADGFKVSIANGDRVRGTIDPAFQVDTFRLDIPSGAQLSVTAKAKSTSRYRHPPSVRLRLLGPSLTDVGGDALQNTPKRARIKKFVADDTGEYALELRGDDFDVGDYTFRARFKYTKRLKIPDVAPGALGVTVKFSAPGGTVLKAIVKPQGRSGARPRIRKISLDAPGAEAIVAPEVGTVTTARHVVDDVLLRDTADYAIELRDAAVSLEPVTLVLKMKPPRLSRRKVSLTEGDLGALPDDVEIVATVLGKTTGTYAAARNPRDADAARASVSVPAGVLDDGAPIVLGLAPEFAAPAGTGLLPVGRPIYVGPDVLDLPQLATGTAGFDVAAMGGDSSTLRVVHRDPSFTLSVLSRQAISVDDGTETVSFPLGRSGAFGAFRLWPAPDLVTLNPFIGGGQGGFPISIFGSGLRPGVLDDGDPIMEILLDDVVVDVTITQVTDLFITFIAPAHLIGDVTFSVRDRETGLSGRLPTGSFEYR